MANGRSAAPRAPLFIDPRAMRGTNPKRRCSTSSSSSTTRRFSPRAKRRVGRCLTYVQEEFESHLKCGRLELGFLRVRCEGCHAEKLVAFSCKRRGFCPSCGARRKAETAALLADEVLPRRPLRQWVLSLPFALRFLLAAHPRALAEVLGIVYRAISGYVLRKARLTHANGQTGAVTLIQRFGSALNLNIHFHMLFLDGAYLTNTRPPVFRRIGAPSAGELQDLLERIAERIGRALERKGLLARDCENSYLTLDPASGGAMDDLIAHSITYRVAMGLRSGQKVFALQSVPAGPLEEQRRGVAQAAGFSLDAGIVIEAEQRGAHSRPSAGSQRGKSATGRSRSDPGARSAGTFTD